MVMPRLELACRPYWLGILLILTSASGFAAKGDATQAIDDRGSEPETPISETWYVIYVAGERVGYSVIRHGEVAADDKAEPTVLWSQTTHMTSLRFGERLEQTVVSHSHENAAGRVLACGWSQQDDGSSTSWQGHIDRDLFVLTDGDHTLEFTWQSEYRGFFGLEQSLLDRPLRIGETRKLWYLMPILNQLASAELTALGVEQWKWREAIVPAMRVHCVTNLRGNRIHSDLWLDEDGKILRQSIPSLHQVYEAADGPSTSLPVMTPKRDLGISSLVPIEGMVDRLPAAEQATYLLEWDADDGDEWSPSSDTATQQVKRIGPGKIWFTVRRATPPCGAAWQGFPREEAAEESGQKSPPFNGPSAASGESISRLAFSVASDEPDPWRLAQALESFTYDYIETKAHTVAWNTAEDVLRTRRGDCTEHAIFLIALCRARGLKVRPVSGLVWVEGKKQFAHHMWVEMWLANDWYPLDGTRPGDVGVAHLRLGADDGGGDDCGYFPLLVSCKIPAEPRLRLVTLQ